MEKIFLFVMELINIFELGLTDEEEIGKIKASIMPFVELLKKEAKTGDRIKMLFVLPKGANLVSAEFLLHRAEEISVDVGFCIEEYQVISTARSTCPVFRKVINYVDYDKTTNLIAEVGYADQKTLLEVAMALNYASMHADITCLIEAKGDCTLSYPVLLMGIANNTRHRKDHLNVINSFIKEE